MYKVIFSNVDKKITKIVKPLKPKKAKKGYSLYVAEKLLKEVYRTINEVGGKTKLTITLNDIDNELHYIFENIIIDDLKEPSLLEILEGEIISSGHENAHKIIVDIKRSYQNELNNEVDTKSKKDKKTKKKLGVMGRFIKKIKKQEKKENQEDGEEMQSQIRDDFAELDDLVAETSITDDFQENRNIQEVEYSINEEDANQKSLIDDFQEIQEERQAGEDNAEIDIKETSNDVLNSDKDVETKEASDQTGALENKENMQIDDDIIDDDFSDLSESQKNYETDQQKVNNEVIFPTYDTYLNLSEMENVIKRYKEHFEKGHLIKFLGLNALSENEAVTELDRIKLKYSFNALDNTEFALLKDQFYNKIEDVKDQVQLQLSSLYEQAMKYDYEGVAKEKLEEEYNNLINEADRIFYEYVDEQEKEYKLKVEKFIHEQEKALEEFRKQQNLDKEVYIKELDTKKSARVELYKDDKQRELNDKKEKLLDDEMSDIKNQYINQLAESKRMSIRNLEVQLDNTMDEVWGDVEEALSRLKKDISKQIPSWEKDMKEKEKAEAIKREEQRKEEELRLEKQRIELQRKQLELKQSTKEKENKKDTEDLMQKKLKEYEEKLNSLLKNHQENLSYQNIVNQSQNQNEEINKTKGISSKIVLSGIVIAVFVLSTGMFLGQNFSKDDSPTVAQVQYEELAESITTLEEEINTPTTPAAKQSTELDTFLKEKNYEKAMTLYKDSESLEKIEETLYQNGDLAMLITFNKTNETTFGKIDEAILSKDTDKALELYNKMSDDEKEKLSSDRKSDLALLFYQKDEKELANKLLEK